MDHHLAKQILESHTPAPPKHNHDEEFNPWACPSVFRIYRECLPPATANSYLPSPRPELGPRVGFLSEHIEQMRREGVHQFQPLQRYFEVRVTPQPLAPMPGLLLSRTPPKPYPTPDDSQFQNNAKVPQMDHTNKPCVTAGNAVLDGENLASRLEELAGMTIAVEASWYLQNILDTPPAKEPLLSALGGLPYWLKGEIEEDLDQWKKYNITPLFVFDGLSIVGKEEMAMRSSKEGARRLEDAWALYNVAKTAEQTKDAVTAFGNSGAIQARSLYRFFQEILYGRGLMYETATHSACAYMAYMDKHPMRADGTQAFEAIMGSLELLLFDIDCSVITRMDFASGIFFAIVKASVLQKLNVSPETLINLMLMTGTSFLPAFPVLKDREIIKQQPYTIVDAVNMYHTAQKSMIGLCETWSEILQKQEPRWEDKYRKAKMAVKHNLHMVDRSANDGGARVMVTEFERLTQDHHEYIGLQLPEELYHYMVHGGIGSRMINWLSWLEMLVFPPLAGGDAEEYRRLVTQQLVPIQAQSIALFTARMHRAFQHKEFVMRFWFDNTTKVVVKATAVDSAPDRIAATWRVAESDFVKQADAIQSSAGSFTFALTSLKDNEFIGHTKKSTAEVGSLKSHEEILANTLWRLLHLRGYVDDSHQLTKWGKALTTTMTKLTALGVECTLAVEDAAFLAFELLRLQQLNVRHPHSEWIGAPQRGSADDQSYCLLIARCACLIKLRHEQMGYTGPLSKNLLAWHSIVSAVREAGRDLVEAITASMFMNAQADRRKARDFGSPQVRKRVNGDWIKLGFSLPFGKDVDIGLGIAVRTYLDDYATINASPEQQQQTKAQYVQEQLPNSVDFAGDLEIAFNFFEALNAGVKELENEIPKEEQAVWAGASKYLNERR